MAGGIAAVAAGQGKLGVLALVLVDELKRRLAAQGVKPALSEVEGLEWDVIRQDLQALDQAEVPEGQIPSHSPLRRLEHIIILFHSRLAAPPSALAL